MSKYKLLKKGMKGATVKQAQQHLIRFGYSLAPYGADGHFGDTTYKAVISFQKDHGLSVDGAIGDQTWTAFTHTVPQDTPEHKPTKGAPWMKYARALIGVHEVRNESKVHQMWRDAKLSGLAKFPASQIPWCSGFACACMENVGIRSSRADSARSWLNWGHGIDQPVDGCVVVFSRSGGGHVGFVVGKANNGNLLVLGGNQGNAVNIKEFTRDRVVGYRLPNGYNADDFTLTVGGNADVSNNEQ